MTIPSLPAFFDMVFTKENHHLSNDGYLYNDQMFQALNNLLSMFNNMASTIFTDYSQLQMPTLNPPITAPALIGINPPSFTSDQINALVSLNATLNPAIIPVGTIWFNSTTNALQFLSNSGVQTITSA